MFCPVQLYLEYIIFTIILASFFFFIWTASESRLESFLERQNNFHLNFEFKDAH